MTHEGEESANSLGGVTRESQTAGRELGECQGRQMRRNGLSSLTLVAMLGIGYGVTLTNRPPIIVARHTPAMPTSAPLPVLDDTNYVEALVRKSRAKPVVVVWTKGERDAAINELEIVFVGMGKGRMVESLVCDLEHSSKRLRSWLQLNGLHEPPAHATVSLFMNARMASAYDGHISTQALWRWASLEIPTAHYEMRKSARVRGMAEPPGFDTRAFDFYGRIAASRPTRHATAAS